MMTFKIQINLDLLAHVIYQTQLQVIVKKFMWNYIMYV